MTRKIPTATITKPMATKMPENWLMSPAGGFIEKYATIAPIMMSVKPTNFSTTANPMGTSLLILEPSRLNFTVPRIILI